MSLDSSLIMILQTGVNDHEMFPVDIRNVRSINLYKRSNSPYVIQPTYYQGETDNLIYPQVIPYSMIEKDKIVVIKVKLGTRDRLKARGKKGDTYENVISQMFGELEGDVGDKRQ